MLKVPMKSLLLALFFVVLLNPVRSAPTETEVGAMIAELQSPQAKVRVRAADRVQQLAEIPEALVPVLFDMVINVRRTGEPLEDLIGLTAVHFADLALAKCGRRIVPQLREYMRNPATRWTAVGILKRIGSDAGDAVPELIVALGDKNRNVVSLALYTLEAVGPRAAPAVDALIALLRDKDDDNREKAIQVLGGLGQAAAKAIPYLKKLSKHEGSLDSSYAAEAIDKIEKAR